MRSKNVRVVELHVDAEDLLGSDVWSDTPERSLIAGMLQRAILDIAGSDRREARKAERWVNSSSDKNFSFNWCCISLDLNPKDIRKILIPSYQ